jgi:carboxymethylenebutenolidase
MDVRSQVTTEWVSFPSGADTIRGYLAIPAGTRNGPAVIMGHEVLGVCEHRQQATRQLAADGIVTLTVDMFSRIGGQPPQEYVDRADKTRKAFLASPDEQVLPDFDAAVRYLATRPEVDANRIGTFGFCLGGGTSIAWAAHSSAVKACVVDCPSIEILATQRPDGKPQSRVDVAPSIRCPFQGHFGELDKVVPVEHARRLEAALRTSGQPVEVYVYPGVDHAFYDDLGPRYHAQAAQESWARAVAFFRRYL